MEKQLFLHLSFSPSFSILSILKRWIKKSDIWFVVHPNFFLCPGWKHYAVHATVWQRHLRPAKTPAPGKEVWLDQTEFMNVHVRLCECLKDLLARARVTVRSSESWRRAETFFLSAGPVLPKFSSLLLSITTTDKALYFILEAARKKACSGLRATSKNPHLFLFKLFVLLLLMSFWSLKSKENSTQKFNRDLFLAMMTGFIFFFPGSVWKNLQAIQLEMSLLPPGGQKENHTSLGKRGATNELKTYYQTLMGIQKHSFPWGIVFSIAWWCH